MHVLYLITCMQSLHAFNMSFNTFNTLMCNDRWFVTITDLHSEIGIEPSVPRRCGRQIHHSNVPGDTEYFRQKISIPVLDHLLPKLRARFDCHQRTALHGISIVPSIAVSLESDICTFHLKPVRDLYENDLSSPQCFVSSTAG